MAKTPTAASARIPNIVKHCALAIYQDKGLRGSGTERFATAIKYAVSRLTEYGFLTADSKEAAPDKVKLTTKGSQRERHHSTEGKRKSVMFDKLYEALTKSRPAEKAETIAPPVGTTRKR